MQRRTNSGSPYESKYGFARGVRSDDRILIAGTAPVPPEGEPVATTPHGQMMRCGSIAIGAIEALGGTVTDVVRTRMYITSPTVADEVGRAHRELFGGSEPAATMVVVAGLLDPDWVVEIEVEAIVSR